MLKFSYNTGGEKDIGVLKMLHCFLAVLFLILLISPWLLFYIAFSIVIVLPIISTALVVGISRY